MAGRKRGPSPRPARLKVLEGNPGHQSRERLTRHLKLPPAVPAAPSWRAIFPDPRVSDEPDRAARAGLASEARRARAVAEAEWARVVPVLDAAGLLATVDAVVLVDYCSVVAMIDGARRQISRRGAVQTGPNGAMVKNPAVTALNQYRAALKFYVGELGLAPASRNDLTGSTAGAAGGGDAGEGGGVRTGTSPFDV